MEPQPSKKWCSVVIKEYIAEKRTNAAQDTCCRLQWIDLANTWASMKPKPRWFPKKAGVGYKSWMSCSGAEPDFVAATESCLDAELEDGEIL